MSALANRGEIEIVVPASVANLGPGFDVLAVAVQLYLRLKVRPAAGRRPTAFPLRRPAAWSAKTTLSAPSSFWRVSAPRLPFSRHRSALRNSHPLRPGQQCRGHRRRPSPLRSHHGTDAPARSAQRRRRPRGTSRQRLCRASRWHDRQLPASRWLDFRRARCTGLRRCT